MKATLPREFYAPKGAVVIKPKHVNAEIHVYEKAGKPYACGFGGKRSKPDFHYSFVSPEARERYVKEYIDGQSAQAASKAAYKAEKNKGHTLKVGDILYSSWGYDQTNIDFYEVIALKGKKMVTIQEISSQDIATDGPHESRMPVPGQYIGEPMNKRPDGYNNISLTTYSSCYPWDGKAKYATGWGYGH